MAVSGAYLDSPTPIAFAHRGGSLVEPNIGVENSMAAFTHAYELGYRYLETDVHVSADGRVYAFHDDTLERMTGNAASIASMTADLIDAELLAGREPIPTLEALIKAFTDARLNIDVKSDDAVDETCAVIEDYDAIDRVCLASFDHARLQRIRARLPGVATATSRREAAMVKLLPYRCFDAGGSIKQWHCRSPRAVGASASSPVDSLIAHMHADSRSTCGPSTMPTRSTAFSISGLTASSPTERTFSRMSS